MAKRAVVLGGGGARGPYQIGVWKAMMELGIDYDIVTGSSVGAINGALMVQRDFELARKMWENLTTRDVIAEMPDFAGGTSHQEVLSFLKQTVEQGGMDITPLEENVRRAVNEERFRASTVAFGLVTSRFPSLKPVQIVKDDIPEGMLNDYILASSAWFPFFQRRTIDGAEYIDGAYADNLPAELAVRCGAEEIVAIDLQGTGIVHTFRKDIPVTYIRSHWNLGDMLAFDTEQAGRNIRLGYLDGLKAWRRLEGNAYAFPLGESSKNARALGSAIDDIRRRTGVSLFKQYARLPRIQEQLRYRSSDKRFLHQHTPDCTLGRAVTTAAEITGELMQIPPDTVYTLRRFNRLLRRQIAWLSHTANDIGDGQFFADSIPDTAPDRAQRRVLGRLYRMLLDGYIRGRMPGSLWRLAAISPVEFVAANYLLALEVAGHIL